MDEQSATLVPTNLSSESSQQEGLISEDQSDIFHTASTMLPDSFESQTATMEEACKFAEKNLRKQFNNRFLQLIHETEFEFGFSTPADKYIRDALTRYGMFARDWISDLFLQNIEIPFVLSAILRVIAHFDYQQMHPQGILIAVTATMHRDADVRECGIRCFESWESADSLRILRNLSFPEDWLNEYLAAVVSELEDVEKHGAPC